MLLNASPRTRVHVVTQSGPGECGFAALEMVVRYFGGAYVRASAERVAGDAGAGLTLDALIAAARTCGLDAQAFAVEVNQLRLLPTPAILHLQPGHFVVLEGGAWGDAFSVVDPASGRRRVTRSEMRRIFTGAAVAFEPLRVRVSSPTSSSLSSSDASRRPGTLLRRIIRAQWTGLALLAGLLVVEGAAFLLAARGAATHLSEWVTPTQNAVTNVRLAWPRALVPPAALVIALAAWWAARVLDRRIALRIGEWTTAYVAAAVAACDPSYLRGRSDRYLEELARDVDPMLNTQAPSPARLLGGFVGAGAFVAAAHLSPRVAATLGASVLGLFGVSACAERLWAGQRLEHGRGLRRTVEQAARAALGRPEDLGAVGVLGTALARWLEVRRSAASRERRSPGLSRSTVVTACLAVTSSMIVTECARRGVTLAGAVELQFLTALALVTSAASHEESGRLQPWRDALTRAEALGAEAERAEAERAEAERAEAERVRSTPPVPSLASAFPPHRPPRARLLGRALVECRSVSYRTHDRAPELLHELCLAVRTGEAVAVLGESGAGKTTLARLLLGHLRPSRGRVLLAGRDVWTLSEDRRRDCIAGLLDGAEPAAGTIADNLFLRGGRDDGLAAARRACALVGLELWIDALPLREATVVGRGGPFGRRQRRLLCLASLLVRPPRVIVLDATLDAFDREAAVRLAHAVASLPSSVILLTSRHDIIPAGYRRHPLSPA